MRFDELFLKQAIPNIIIQGNVPHNPAISIDSRTIKPGDIFVALQGEQCDGHNFIAQAFERGAAAVMIAQDKKHAVPAGCADKTIFIVVDPLHALVAMAAAWRKQFTYPVIGITGSIGKTSTKEMMARMFEDDGWRVIASAGNQNTVIGLAMNIMKMRSDHQIAVFELGINKRGEMSQLTQLLRPTNAVITYIGHSHMEGLGSLQDIALEKREIFKYFTEHNIGFINGDQSILSAVAYAHPVIKFGLKTTNQIQARKIRVNDSQVSFILKLYKKKYEIILPHPHVAMVNNVLAAAVVAQFFDVDHAVIAQAMQVPLAIPGRFEHKPLRNQQGHIIHDAYNANPESMKAALLAFGQLRAIGKKIAVIGDMLELGITSPFWHRQIGRFFHKIPSVRQVILVGNMVQWTKRTMPYGVRVDLVPSWKEAVELLKSKLEIGSHVLVKASQGMELQKLVDQFI